MAYIYENVMMKLIILYAKYFNENLKWPGGHYSLYGPLRTEPTSVSILFPLPYPVDRTPVMGWHWAGGREWNTRPDPEVAGHSLEHFSACACLSPEIGSLVVITAPPRDAPCLAWSKDSANTVFVFLTSKVLWL